MSVYTFLDYVNNIWYLILATFQESNIICSFKNIVLSTYHKSGKVIDIRVDKALDKTNTGTDPK